MTGGFHGSICTALFGSLVLALGSPLQALADDSSGLQTSVAVDLVGQFGTASDTHTGRFEAREAELTFFAPVDHLFDGTLSLAAHQEDGSATFEIHEAFVGSTRLIPRMRFRLGQFFPAVGRLQQFHRHDWLFTSAPKFYHEFFGEEGFLDTGLEVSLLAPTGLYLDLTGGAASGWTFGHSHSQGELPLVPTHYLRLATFLPTGGSDGIALGGNYVGRTSGAGEIRRHYGVDVTGKWREGRTVRWLVQSEAWMRNLIPSASEEQNELGAYLYGQTALSESLALGVRFDYYSILTLKNAMGESLANASLGLTPVLSWKASEFSSFRLSYTHEHQYQQSAASGNFGMLQLQSTFILGAHPAHDF